MARPAGLPPKRAQHGRPPESDSSTANTGLRWGEATALRACDIDFDRRRVDVSRAFSDVGGRVVLGTPKSHLSRSVPVPRFIALDLAAAVDGKRPADLVFTMPGGTIMRLSNWRGTAFLPARARAGLSDRFRIHDLRHTAESLMIKAGYPPKMLQEIMGHASIRVRVSAAQAGKLTGWAAAWPERTWAQAGRIARLSLWSSVANVS